MKSPNALQGPPRWHAAAAALALFGVSWGLAASHVVRNEGFGAGDLRAFAFWCSIAMFAVYPALRGFQRLVQRVPLFIAVGLACVSGVAMGFVWTRIVAFVLGPWVGAFSFPVLRCWLAGAIAAFQCALVLQRPKVWPAALILAVGLPTGLGTGLTWYYAPPPDAIIFLRPGTTAAQVTHVWNNVLGVATDRGTTHLPGVRGMSRSDDSRPGIRLSFSPRTTLERREAILSMARTIEYLDEIVDAKPVTREDLKRRRHPSNEKGEPE